MSEADPDYFARLSKLQSPAFLWIGCSDSRVSADQITGLSPGEVFVHRNIANQVIHTDFNCLSVIQFAVDVLAVKHIIVCGHYGCGGVGAAMQSASRGFVDNWLRHLKDLANLHKAELDGLATEPRLDRLAELNTMHQVLHVGESLFVRNAWSGGQPLAIHGWMYALRDGLLVDLAVSLRAEDDTRHLRERLGPSGRRSKLP
jgi:carbonic anhydrase